MLNYSSINRPNCGQQPKMEFHQWVCYGELVLYAPIAVDSKPLSVLPLCLQLFHLSSWYAFSLPPILAYDPELTVLRANFYHHLLDSPAQYPNHRHVRYKFYHDEWMLYLQSFQLYSVIRMLFLAIFLKKRNNLHRFSFALLKINQFHFMFQNIIWTLPIEFDRIKLEWFLARKSQSQP